MKKTASSSKEIFLSYWQAGYEGADHINCVGQPLSMNHATRHGTRAYDDYLLLQDFVNELQAESTITRALWQEGKN